MSQMMLSHEKQLKPDMPFSSIWFSGRSDSLL